MRRLTPVSLGIVILSAGTIVAGYFIFKNQIESRDKKVFDATVQTTLVNYQDKLQYIREDVELLHILASESFFDTSRARRLLTTSSQFAALSLSYLVYPHQVDEFYSVFNYSVASDPSNPFEVITVDAQFSGGLFQNLMDNPQRRQVVLDLHSSNSPAVMTMTDRRRAGRPEDFSIFVLLQLNGTTATPGFDGVISAIFDVPSPHGSSEIYQEISFNDISLAETQHLSCFDTHQRKDRLVLDDLELRILSCGDNPSSFVLETIFAFTVVMVVFLLFMSAATTFFDWRTTSHILRLEHKHSLMTAFVCHELRNPVMRLQLRCQMAAEDPTHLRDLTHDVDYVSSIVNDVLDAKGVAEGLFMLHGKRVQLDGWLRGFLQRLLPASQLTCTFNFDTSLRKPIVVDVHRAAQIVENVTDTLLYHTTDPSMRIRCWIEKDSWLCIILTCHTAEEITIPDDPTETLKFRRSSYHKQSKCCRQNFLVAPRSRLAPDMLSPAGLRRLFNKEIRGLPMIHSYQGRGEESPRSVTRTGYGMATAKILARGLGGDIFSRKRGVEQEVLIILYCEQNEEVTAV
jgi:hypothetical protein